mmetsp:Transcript_78333/g.234763  ORF Transcript_78333/g.234763 Transcript_78333/m.234763 type:complete len:127 (-) Transcript_78333:633-1013(-)
MQQSHSKTRSGLAKRVRLAEAALELLRLILMRAQYAKWSFVRIAAQCAKWRFCAHRGAALATCACTCKPTTVMRTLGEYKLTFGCTSRPPAAQSAEAQRRRPSRPRAPVASRWKGRRLRCATAGDQ